MRKFINFLLISMFTSVLCMAQVGIGTTTPHESAALHIEDGDRGLLIPVISSLTAVTPPIADGLMVFLSSENRFYVYNSNVSPRWQCINPFNTNSATNQISTTTDYNSVSGNFSGNFTGDFEGDFTGDVSGTLEATGTNKFSGNGTVPVGGIIMWSGTTVPTGWALCNGSNGTPDLRGRFIVGYDSRNADYNNPGNYSSNGTNAGDMGGNSSTTLTVSNLPSHDHQVIDPGHIHQIEVDRSNGASVESPFGYGDETGNTGDLNIGSSKTGITIGNRGGGQSFENRPPYYVLAFIMRKQ